MNVLNNLKDGKYKDKRYNKTLSYKITNLLGQGSFGEVYLGKKDDGELIAIKAKKILADPGLMQKSNELFRCELEALYNLEHPNILVFLGAEFRGGDVVSLITEFIEGETLDKIIKRFYFLTEVYIQSYMKQIMDALAYIHEKLVMHRDLKCSNIMLASKNNNQYIKIIDFGMAKHFNIDDSTITDHEMMSNTFVGTYPYMSPELLYNSLYNSKTDIWSVGICLYEMSMGIPVIRQTNQNGKVIDIKIAVYNGYVQCPNLSPLANDFLQNCLLKDLELRPSATKLLHHPFIKNCINPVLGYQYQNF